MGSEFWNDFVAENQQTTRRFHDDLEDVGVASFHWPPKHIYRIKSNLAVHFGGAILTL